MSALSIVTVYVVLDDTLKAIGHQDDCRTRFSTAEILTVSVLAAKYFYNHQERALCVLQMLGAVPRLSIFDGGFNGARWCLHWRQYGAEVITTPPTNAPDAWSSADQRWSRQHRQIIETVFSRLGEVFGCSCNFTLLSTGQIF